MPAEKSCKRYYSSLAGWIRILIGSLLSLGLVAVVATRGMATEIGGTSVLQRFVGELVAERTVVVGVVLLTALLFLLGAAFVWLFVKNVGRATGEEVHVELSENGVSGERKGSQYWQSSGLDVPYDTITAVEFVDSRASSMRLEPGNSRAPKLFAGRSRNWFRLERTQGPVIYVGSDRHEDLAEPIARHVPIDVNAKPFRSNRGARRPSSASADRTAGASSDPLTVARSS